MPIVKIGIQTRSLGVPLRKALVLAAKLGAAAVEVDLRNELPLADLTQTATRQFRRLLEDNRLTLSAVSYPTRRGYEHTAELERRLQGTHRAMKAAAELGARVVVNRAFGQLPDADDAERTVLVQSLLSLASEGARVGARFAATTTGAPVAQLAELLAETPEGTLGVSLNPANLLASGQTPVDAIAPLGSRVLHVHANDAVRDFGSNQVERTELGRGAADIPALVATLAAHDYTGWYTLERTGSTHPETEFANAVEYLRTLEQ